MKNNDFNPGAIFIVPGFLIQQVLHVIKRISSV